MPVSIPGPLTGPRPVIILLASEPLLVLYLLPALRFPLALSMQTLALHLVASESEGVSGLSPRDAGPCDAV